MSHSSRCRRKFQRQSSFAVRQLLEMPHLQDLSIILTQLLDRLNKPQLHFPSNRRSCRSQLHVGQPSDQVQRTLVRVGSRHQRSFAIDTAALSPPVPPVHVDQSISSQLPEPQVEGQGGLVEVLGQSARRFEQHILNDIAGIHTTSDCAVHAMVDEFPERVAVPIHQAVDRLGISIACRREQFAGAIRIGPDAF